MYVYICMYVGMYVCLYVCLCVCMQVCMRASMHACMYALWHAGHSTTKNKTDTVMLRRNGDYFVNDASDPDPCTKVRDAQLHTHANLHKHAHTRTHTFRFSFALEEASLQEWFHVWIAVSCSVLHSVAMRYSVVQLQWVICYLSHQPKRFNPPTLFLKVECSAIIKSARTHDTCTHTHVHKQNTTNMYAHPHTQTHTNENKRRQQWAQIPSLPGLLFKFRSVRLHSRTYDHQNTHTCTHTLSLTYPHT